jgi:hypothetical protein
VPATALLIARTGAPGDAEGRLAGVRRAGVQSRVSARRIGCIQLAVLGSGVIVAILIAVGVVIIAGTVALTSVPIDRLAFVAVGALALTVTWNGLRVGGGAFGNGFLVLAVLAVIVHVKVGRRPIFVPPWLLACAALMIVSALIVSIFPPSVRIQNLTQLQFNQQFAIVGVPVNVLAPPRSNVAALVKFEVALLLMPMVFWLVSTTTWRINRLLDLFTIGAAINALVGIADRAGFHSLSPYSASYGGVRSAGLTVHPNYLALTCLFAMPLALRWVGRSSRATAAGLATTLLLVGGEYVTGSRAGEATAVGGIVLAIAFLPRLRPGLRYVIPVLGMVAVAALAFTHAGRSIVNQLRLGGPTTSTTGSNYERAIAAHVAEAQIGPRPLEGVGFAVDNDAQNIYLQILASGGIIAMAGFLVLIGGLARCVARSLRGPVREEAIAIGIGVALWLINGYYDSQIADKYLYVLPGILIACARLSSQRAARAPVEVEAVAVGRLGPPAIAPVPVLEPVGPGAAVV